MDELNLIVMGKTGAGKSTLINAVLKEDLAPTGSGQAVTRENQVYTKRMLLPLYKSASTQGDYRMVARTLNMYDTVGLEIDSSITQETLREIKKFIDNIECMSEVRKEFYKKIIEQRYNVIKEVPKGTGQNGNE